MEQAKEAAATVTEFFQGNPYSTPTGQHVERATDGNNASESWELNMQVCDMANYSDECARDALRAVRKRLLTQMGKSHTSVMYTLTLLETMVKNGNRHVLDMIMKKEFIQQLVVIIGPKYDPPQVVQEKVLSMIQAWSDAFRHTPNLVGVYECYEELKSKGVEFPMTDLDAMAPIVTPQRTVEQAANPSPTRAAIPAAERPAQPRPTSGTVNPSGEQLTKLRGDLDVVHGNLRVLREMLSSLHPGAESADDYALLVELNGTCRQMQSRLVQLLAQVANDDVVNELLLVNDELNNVAEKYDRYMDNRRKQSNAKPTNEQTAPVASASSNLIDFDGGSSAPPAKEICAMAVNDDKFDMFAATRQTTMEQERIEGSSYADNSESQSQTEQSLSSAAQHNTDLSATDASQIDVQLPAETSNAPDAKAFDNYIASRSPEKKPKDENDGL